MAERKIGKASNDPWDVLGLPNPLRPKPKAGPPAPQQSQLERVGVKVPPVQAKPAPKPKVSAPKTKQIPWEERSTYNGFRKLIQDLPTVDPTLLDSYLYIQRESGGKKIDPFVPKGMAGGYKVPQQAFNQARALARTPEGQAQMRAEVEAFRAQRRQLAPMVRQQAQQLSPEITAPLAPKRQGPAPLIAGTPLPADEKSRILAEQRARMDEQSFRTGTDRGRAVTSIKDAEKQLSQLLSPVTGPLAAAIARTSPVLAATGQTQGAESALRELPGQLALGIPTGLNDLLTVLDSDTGLRPEQKIPFVLGAIVNLGGAGVGAATLSSDVAKAGAAIARARMTLQGAKPGPAVRAAERGLANMAENVRAGRVTPEQARALEAAFPARPTPRVPSVTPPPTGAARLGPEPAVQPAQAVKAAETLVAPAKAPEVPVTPAKPVQVPELVQSRAMNVAVSSNPSISSTGKLGNEGKLQKKELADLRKQGEAMASDRPPFWQARAKQGGEMGPNGQWYPGGKFIATAPETVKGQFRKIKAAGEAREKSSLPLNETEVAASGAGAYSRPADKSRWYNGPVELNTDLRMIGDRRITPEDEAKFAEGIAYWNDLVRRVDSGEPGFRWKNQKGEGILVVDTNLHPEFTSYGQIARYIAKGELIPEQLVPKAKELIDGLDIDRYQELVQWNLGRTTPSPTAPVEVAKAQPKPPTKPQNVIPEQPPATTRAERLRTELKTASPARAEEIQSDLKALGMREAAEKRKATGTMTPKQAAEAERQANKVVPGVRVNTPEGPGKAVSYPVYSKVRVELDAGGSKRFDRADVTRAVDEAPAPKPKSVKPQKALDTVPDVKSSQYPDDAELNTIGSATIVKKFPGVFESADEKVRTLPSWSTVDALVNKAAIRAGKTYGADRASAVRLIAAHQYLDNLGMAERYLSAADVEKLGKATTRLRKEFGLPPGARADGWELVRMARDAAPSAPKPTDTPTWAGKVTEKADARLAELEAIRAKKGRRIEGKQKGVVNIGPEDFEYVAWQAIKTAAQTLEPIEKVIRGLAKAERFTESEIQETIKVARGIGKAEGIPDEAFGVAAKAKQVKAKPAEIAEDIVAARKAFTTKEREAKGLGPLDSRGFSVKKFADDAVKDLKKVDLPKFQARIRELVELDSMGRAKAAQSGKALVTEKETALLTAYKRGLRDRQNEFGDLMHNGKTAEERRIAAQEFNSLEEQVKMVDQALNTSSGRFQAFGAALQTAFARGYDYVSLRNYASASVNGAKLTEEQDKALKALADQIKGKDAMIESLKKRIESMPAEVLVSPDPAMAGVYDDWLKAHETLFGLQDYLKRVKAEAKSATSMTSRVQTKIAKTEADLVIAQRKLEEAKAKLEDLIAQKKDAVSEARSVRAKAMNEAKPPRSARQFRDMTMAGVMSRREAALAKLKRLGVVASDAKVKEPAPTGGFGSKRAGMARIAKGKEVIPGMKESQQDQVASAARALIRTYVDEAVILKETLPSTKLPTVAEAIDQVLADLSIKLTPDQLLDLIGGKYKTVALEVDIAKREADQLLAQIKKQGELKALAPLARNVKQVASALKAGWNAPRSFMFAGDLSAMGIQGRKALLLGYSREWQQAVKVQWKPVWEGKPAYERYMAGLERRPAYKEAIKSGIEFTDAEGLSRHEEQFASSIIDWMAEVRQVKNKTLQSISNTANKVVQPIKRSEYAYTAMLNELRMGMYETARVGLADDPESLKRLAGFINIVTGRADIQSRTAKGAVDFASNFVIAPRFYVSQMQDLAMVPFWKALIAQDKPMINITAKYYANKLKWLGAVGVLMGGIALAKDWASKNNRQWPKEMDWQFDFNPISNDLGALSNPHLGIKINVIGNDVQWIRPIFQSIYGTKTVRGDYIKPRGDLAGMVEPAMRLGLNKSVPTARIAADWINRETYNFNTGEKEPLGLDWRTAYVGGLKYVLPLSVSGTIEAGWDNRNNLLSGESGKDFGSVVANIFGAPFAKMPPPKAKAESKNPKKPKQRSIADIIRSQS